MRHLERTTRITAVLTAVLLLYLTGCQQLRVPAFDPTGQRVFSPSDTMSLSCLNDSRARGCGLLPKPAWQQPLTPPPCPEPAPPVPPGARVPAAAPPTAPRIMQKGVPGTIMLNPQRMIVPVGSEVVLLSGLCGEDGFLVTHQPIEFMLSRDSVGHFVAVSDQDAMWCPSKKLSADYAIARTCSRSQVVTRGTPSVTDDVVQQKGQCWVSLTSASEGTSYVTAVATQGATWPQRRVAATIYWVDAKWAFPNPVSVPAGSPHTLVTQVQRTATGAPVTGFVVRYEIISGVPATFGPDGATAIEVRTDDQGQGSATLQPASGEPGLTQVRIDVVRPPDPNSDAPRTVLGEGFTSITWSAPGLALRATGPETATLDATLVYRLEVHNPGDIPTRDIVVRATLPPSLEFISSNPPAQLFGNRAEWRLSEVPPKSVQVVEVNLRAAAGGGVRYTFEATSAQGLQAEAFVDTQVTRPALLMKVAGPETAVVGDKVQFRIEVTNAGDQPLDNVTISDRFDSGLEHVEGLTSPIQKLLGRLEPSQTKVFAVSFLVRRAGQICHSLEVSAPGGQYAQAQACLDATPPAVTAQPGLEVTKTVVAEARVGTSVQFSNRITNTGNVTLTDLRITDYYDPELERLEASEGFDRVAWAAGELVWMVPQLAPGETAQRDVLCLCRQAAAAALSRVTVTAAGNVTDTGEARVRIVAAPTPQSPPAPPAPGAPPAVGGAARERLTLDISELGDPIKLGETTTYLLTIKNERAVPDQDVVVRIELPPGLQFESVTGPTQLRNLSPDRRIATIGAIREMRAGETLQPPYRVEVTGTQAGEHAVRVTVTSRFEPQGVTAQETTTVYAP